MSTHEVLELGARPARPWLRWGALAVALALAAPLAHVGLWWATRPPPDFTLSQLQDAYYGMVRNDGSNDMSTFTAASAPAGDPGLRVVPVDCGPLYDPVVANLLPTGVLDGVSTYWIDQGTTSISLFTLRYPTTAAAEAAYAEVGAALDRCEGRQVQFDTAMVGGVTRTVGVNPTTAVITQRGWLLDRGSAGRFGFRIMLLGNTVSWQYRYDPDNTGTFSRRDDGQAAQHLMDGLALQLQAVRGS